MGCEVSLVKTRLRMPPKMPIPPRPALAAPGAAVRTKA